jgi:hypothetical protein
MSDTGGRSSTSQETRARQRSAAAVPVYLIILVGLQVFLVTVSVEAFLTDEEGLAWAAATTSVVLAVCGGAFVRYLRA